MSTQQGTQGIDEPAGVLLDGEFYPFAMGMELGDTVVIELTTGLPVEEWAAIHDPDDEKPRTIILIGLVAAAVRRKHPNWPPGRVAKFVSSIDFSKVEAPRVGEIDPPSQGAETAPASHPQASTSTSSPPSPDGYAVAPDTSSDTPLPLTTGSHP